MFTVDNIIVNEDIKSRIEVLKVITHKATSLGIVNSKDQLLEALLDREAQTCTGMVNGIAIPHARSKVIKKAAIIYIKLPQAIEWPSLDDKDVDMIFCLLAPENSGELSHLEMLSKVACSLMDEDYITSLRNESNEIDIFNLINEQL